MGFGVYGWVGVGVCMLGCMLGCVCQNKLFGSASIGFIKRSRLKSTQDDSLAYLHLCHVCEKGKMTREMFKFKM